MGVQSTGDKNQVKSEQEQVKKPELAPAVPGIDYDKLAEAMLRLMPKPVQSESINTVELVKAIKNDDKGEKHQAHGLTINEMKAIKESQMNGKVEMMPANKISRYSIPVVEKQFVHFSTEKIQYKQDTDIKISKPRYHVKTVEDFNRMSKTVKQKGDELNPENAFAGLKVIILHDPRIKVEDEGVAEKQKFGMAEVLQEMTEEGVRSVYFDTYQEEALPSDSKQVMIDMILEKTK